MDSLNAAHRHLQPPRASPEARTFVDTRMATIISILLVQNMWQIGQREMECVEKSLRVALTIIRDDLETLVQRDGSNDGGQVHEGCMSLLTLRYILSKKMTYYRSQWSAEAMRLPEVSNQMDIRDQMISTFTRLRGFYFLGLYMTNRAILPKEQQLQQHQQQQQVVNQLGQAAVQQIAPIFPQLRDIAIILEAVKDSFVLL